MSEPPYNPYAAPQALPIHVGARAPGQNLKWGYLGLSTMLVASEVVIAFWRELHLPFDAWQIARAFLYVFLWSRIALVLAWIYQSWRGIPEGWRTITPGRAVMTLLVPVYGLYWMCVVSLRLCDALDGALRAASDPRRAPRAWAIAAPSLSLASVAIWLVTRSFLPVHPFVTTVVSTVSWFGFIHHCDITRRAVVEVAHQISRDVVPPHPTQPVSVGSAVGTAAAFFFFLVFVLAVWQFLSPGSPR